METNSDEWSAIDGAGSVGSVTTGTESFVKVVTATQDEEPPLSLQATPGNEFVGIRSTQTKIQIAATIKARDLVEEDGSSTARAPVDIVVALDKSGSMGGDKIQGCKRTMELMVRHLGSNDRLGLVSFESETILEFPPMFMTKENKEEALHKIKMIQAGGGTNLSGGLATAAMELARMDMPNSVRCIFLLTDGHPNGGISEPSILVDMVKGLNKSEDDFNSSSEKGCALLHFAASDSNFHGPEFYPEDLNPVITNKPISLFCFGYGSDHNSQVLTAMSNATPGGGYYFVEKDSNVASAFGDAMGGVLSVVAQGVTLSISVPPEAQAQGAKILEIHHKQATKRISSTCYTVNVGDFYAEEERDVLFEMSLAASSTAPPPGLLVNHVDAVVSFMDTIHKRPASLGPVQCRIGRPDNSNVSPLNEHVEIQWLRIQTVRAIEAANETAAVKHDLDGARKTLKDAEKRIINSNVYKKKKEHGAAGALPFLLEVLLEDLRDLITNFRSFHCYSASGSHSAATVSLGYERQRCVESSASRSNGFRTSRKQDMSMRFMS